MSWRRHRINSASRVNQRNRFNPKKDLGGVFSHTKEVLKKIQEEKDRAERRAKERAAREAAAAKG